MYPIVFIIMATCGVQSVVCRVRRFHPPDFDVACKYDPSSFFELRRGRNGWIPGKAVSRYVGIEVSK